MNIITSKGKDKETVNILLNILYIFLLNQLFSDSKLFYTEEDKKKIKNLLLSNFPPKLRRDLWLIASGAKKEMQDFPNYYNDILNNYPDYIPSLYEKTIENDLNRTFPEEEFFQDKENINKIRNILLAFSRRNSSIGYTQGFNFIVGRLLKIIGNEVSNKYI